MENPQPLQVPVETDIRKERKNFSRIGISLTVYLLITTALQLLLNYICTSSFTAFAESGWYTWILSYMPQAIIAAPVCLLMLRTKEPQEQPNGKIKAGNYIAIIIMCISVMYIGNLIGSLITNIFGAGNPIATVVANSNLWATFIFAVILAPIVEELIFRKAIITILRKYGDKTAILVSALLFGLMHGNLSQFFYAFGLGLLFGYVYSKTGKIRYSIGLHMIINFIGSFVGTLILRAINNINMDALNNITAMDSAALSEALGGSLGSILFVGIYFLALIGLVIAGLVLLITKWKKAVLANGTVDIPKGSKGKIIFGNPGMIIYLAACTAFIVASFIIF